MNTNKSIARNVIACVVGVPFNQAFGEKPITMAGIRRYCEKTGQIRTMNTMLSKFGVNV